jgi:hypothetical protein
VVWLGVTLSEPLAPTVPIPGWMSTLFAFAEFHVSVTDCPAATACLSAVSETLTLPVTPTDVLALAVPPGPVAVAWYVVDCAGATLICPLSATCPMPLSISTLVACCDCQLKVAVPPAATSDGVADIVTCGACSAGGGFDAAPPAQPVAVIARVARKNANEEESSALGQSFADFTVLVSGVSLRTS